ncbi:NAD(P)-dependent alcohol dehydrogenase protein [Mycena sanguinolenta]|uniref:NAD(P)-dependent alcohol dehydrogenase protein n=1 Tax=Mycena sanguinolenta TaxID=230812 RepID=A0A8H6ZFK3_9AGAR|nr:NAD(P)-dependent alcohol dehydrogenase protein [Mycena sanguinolenta]
MGLESTVFKGSASGSIVEGKTQSNGPTGNEVLVRITHSGICGTDEEYRYADMVPGTKALRLGTNIARTANGTVMQISTKALSARTPSGTHRLFSPCLQGLHLRTPPLSCAVEPLYNVIESYNIRPADRVGVIGVGGLGHLAIQFLTKMGGSPVMFSGTDSKRQEAMQLGATEFTPRKRLAQLEIVCAIFRIYCGGRLLAISTRFLNIIKPTGTIFPLPADTELRIPFLLIVVQGINIQGSLVAWRSVHRRMLDFAARHKIKPIIERFLTTRNGVEEGIAKLREEKMPYRGVLVAQ